MMNQITLIGNLGKDPELKRTSGGSEYAVFSLATSENRLVNDQWQKETEWHYIKVWGQQTERVMRQLKKGGKAWVQGKLRSYEVDGQRRYEVVCQRWIALDPRQRDANDLAPGDLLPPESIGSSIADQPWAQPVQTPSWVNKPY
jgi:single-strand DNA-binding protein